ncbi:MAG: acetylglutamate kinase [Acidobacteriota bacterium]|nr:acetylglutamate kinase [Acidobacteriota bacterium]
MTKTPVAVLKLGGELLTEERTRRQVSRAMGRLAASSALVVVHGGGRDVDTDLAARGISTHAVDGLRVTDAATLEVVVGMLAGRVNTQLVASARCEGVHAVGLTATDTDVTTATRNPPYEATDGTVVDLGFVGQPIDTGPPTLLVHLTNTGFVPIVASIGADDTGQLLNINADTLAGHLASCLQATRLLIAGGTPGVLDKDGQTIPSIDEPSLAQLIDDGSATAGMVAKLVACRNAGLRGVQRIDIVDGTQTDDFESSAGTHIKVSVQRG